MYERRVPYYSINSLCCCTGLNNHIFSTALAGDILSASQVITYGQTQSVYNSMYFISHCRNMISCGIYTHAIARSKAIFIMCINCLALNNCSSNDLYGLDIRTLGTESLLFLADVFEQLKPIMLNLVPNIHGPTIEEFYEQTVY